MKQSTNHLLMVEPAVFFANPQTMDTNVYQIAEEGVDQEQILLKAQHEFQEYRDMLVEHGVMVTTAIGHESCPDMVFPNWASTYDDGRLILYPMYAENRSFERRPRIIDKLRRFYPHVTDWTGYEKEGLALEATASIVADHVNKRAYSGLSKRTDLELVEKWADLTGYDVISFETRSHAGPPVYHTDFLMYIGTDMAGICTECFVDEKMRDRVVGRLRETHEVVEFTMEQLQANCCNALEVLGLQDEKMITFSAAAKNVLRDDQLDIIQKHYCTLICPDLQTLEKYGGGSARCMLMELF